MESKLLSEPSRRRGCGKNHRPVLAPQLLHLFSCNPVQPIAALAVYVAFIIVNKHLTAQLAVTFRAGTMKKTSKPVF